MERKDSNSSNGRGSVNPRGGFAYGCDKAMMKRSESELALEEFLRMATVAHPLPPSDDHHLKTDSGGDSWSLPTSTLTDLDSPFLTWEMARGNSPSSGGLGAAPLWCQNLMTIHSTIPAPTSTPTDSQSSIFVGTVNKPKVVGGLGRDATSGSSSLEPSDDDDGEIEPGSCEQSAGPNDKQSRRKISNRESARRSRKRKQEHLVGLEVQVNDLRGENETLLEQLVNAAQQFRDADVNNRVLNSDVEALRAKVKLAEDMVARGSYNCSFNCLLQHLNLQPPINLRSSLSRIANVSPTVTIQGDNNSSFTTGSTITRQNSCIGVGNGNRGNTNMAKGIVSEASCVSSEIWP